MKSKVADRVKEQVEHVQETWQEGKQSARELTESAMMKSKDAAHHADEWVHDNSWKLLGITLAVGLILGLLLNGGTHEYEQERLPR